MRFATLTIPLAAPGFYEVCAIAPDRPPGCANGFLAAGGGLDLSIELGARAMQPGAS